ncbi:hypothetical protein CHS0354_028078 [Potamilus streckersoni]|uniref:PDZ domain-containing protein n=2 Tax=Potamilus streckersoni TaxID=2493646 RepID=A0AAE0THX0_9BIVA|nr:hypothetical protein CHS0354_028078 [Potamilus streckersoni]
MDNGNRVTITLTGGVPWGFRLQGGGNFPLEVAKVRKKSKAHACDLQEGDIVLSINGVNLSNKSHKSAMDIIDMASDKLVLEVSRGSGRSIILCQIDPQRQLRVSPAMNETKRSHSPRGQVRVSPAMVGSNGRSPSPGLVSKTATTITSPDGSFKREVHTEEYESDVDGNKITRVVTQENVTQVKSPVMWQPKSVSCSSSSTPLQIIQADAQTKKSPVMWQPRSSSTTPVPSTHTVTIEITDNRHLTSPATWQSKVSPQTQSASQSQTTTVKEQTKTSYLVTPTTGQTKHVSPIPAQWDTFQSQTLQSTCEGKENMAPVQGSNQRAPSPAAPVFKVRNVLSEHRQKQPATWQPEMSSSKGSRAAEFFDEDFYPKFQIPKPTWSPMKDVKSQSSQASQVPTTGKVPPPPPPPPPPPVPPKPSKAAKAWHPTFTSTPKRQISYMEEELTEMPESDIHPTPDHLPIFAPPVEITWDDSGIHETIHTIRARSLSMESSDASSTHLRTKQRKLYSDSAFYDDPIANYPTIQDQISMCRKIAQSLTSAANRRARGAKMFAKRKRKSTKWVHEGPFSVSSEYSSIAGDIANINDLDNDLDPSEGGTRPLFMFRIPSIRTQVTEPQKMSLTREEFENMRLGRQKCEHTTMSPQDCFTIAADLHSSRNRGARLFQKIQAKSENWVVDETTARKPTPQISKLEQMLQQGGRPQTSLWDAASGNPYGIINAAFNNDPVKNRIIIQAKPPQKEISSPISPPLQPVVKHCLKPDSQLQILEGENFNRTARGWALTQDQSTSKGPEIIDSSAS